MPFCLSGSFIKFQGDTDCKIDDLNPIWVKLLSQSQLSNPSDLPCYVEDDLCLFRAYLLILNEKISSQAACIKHTRWIGIEVIKYDWQHAVIKILNAAAALTSNWGSVAFNLTIQVPVPYRYTRWALAQDIERVFLCWSNYLTMINRFMYLIFKQQFYNRFWSPLSIYWKKCVWHTLNDYEVT